MNRDVYSCIVHSNSKAALAFKKLFLTLGCITDIFNTLEEAADNFGKKKYNILLLDFDFYDSLSLKFLEGLQEQKLMERIYLIGTGFDINQQMITRLQQFNLVGYLKKPVNEETIKDRLGRILDKCHFSYDEKRRHVRVTPDPEDMIQCTFNLPGSGKHISAKVINLSLGGLAFELYQDIEDKELAVGKPIRHLVFNAPIKEVDVEIEVVKKTDTFVACKFLQFYNNTNEILARYIIRRLQS